MNPHLDLPMLTFDKLSIRLAMCTTLCSSCGMQETFTTRDGIVLRDNTGLVEMWAVEAATDSVIEARGRGRGKLSYLTVEFFDGPPDDGIAGDYSVQRAYIRAQFFPCYEAFIHELCHHLQYAIEGDVDYNHTTKPYWVVDGVRDTAELLTKEKLSCL